MKNFRILIILLAFLACIMGCRNIKVSKDDDHVLFLNKESKIELHKDEFILTKNSTGYHLTIVNEKKLQIIKELNKPNIEVISENINFIAKGNNIFSSAVPEDSDYFYPTDEEFKIVFFKYNTVSILRK